MGHMYSWGDQVVDDTDKGESQDKGQDIVKDIGPTTILEEDNDYKSMNSMDCGPKERRMGQMSQ